MKKRTDRVTGVSVMGSAPWGTHICQFYQTKGDLVDILVPYFKAGLESNELCLWLTCEPLGVQEAKASLTKAVRDLNNYINEGRIEIINAAEWYAGSGKFGSDDVLQRLIEKEKLALQRGFNGLRVAGNTMWLKRRDWKAFSDYEAAVESIIGRHRILAVCSYSLDKCGASDVIGVVNSHRFTLIRQKGKWEIVQNVGRKKAEQMLWRSEQQYRLLTENIGDVIWTTTMDAPDKVTYITPSVAGLLGYSVEEAMAKSMREIFTPSSVETAMEALAEELAAEKAEQRALTSSRILELELKHKDGYAVPVEVKYSLLRRSGKQPVEIMAIAREITQRKQAEEEARRSTERMVKAMEDTMQAMAMIVEMRDPYTAGHQRRVTKLACAIAEEVGLSEEQITGIRLAGLIHDIGKVRIPAEILTNPDGLSEAEFAMIKTHPLLGYEILKNMDLPWPIAQIVHQHHERMDGSGYPSGLSGEEIILEARVLAVADVVEAIASHRPYRPARGINKALEEISKNRGRLYDPGVVDACLQLFRDQRFEFE